LITTIDDGGIRTLTMDRPSNRNALDRAGFSSLDRSLRDAAGQDTVSVVIWTGAGGHFTAGNDLRELEAIDSAALSSHPFHSLVETISTFPKPIVAAVEGVAVGAGVTLLAHVDFVIAAATARFRAPFSQLGVPTEGGSSALLPLVVGPRMAARMLLLGDWITGEEAAACGLATTTVADGTALVEAATLARRLADLPAAAVSATKCLLVAARQEAVASATMRERLLGLPLYTDLAQRAAVTAITTSRSGRGDGGGDGTRTRT
jgi:enoyl-CoA hydratase/carnithine racemase